MEMDCFVGIDLGTSSVKALAIDTSGNILSMGQCGYDIVKPGLREAEQDMESLWDATVNAVRKMLRDRPDLKSYIRGVGFSGQMHGLVMVDNQCRPLYRAIIWADQRSRDEIEEIYNIIPREEVQNSFRNQLSTGFLLPSLIWIKKNRPDIYRKIYKVLLPKDYIRYKMCGELGTDETDAGGTGIWNMRDRCWEEGFMEKLQISKEIFPKVYLPHEKAGEVTKFCENEMGIKEGTFVSFGGGDSLMMELGNGMIETGMAASTIGTACHLTCVSKEMVYDPLYRTNTWCHCDKHLWSVMGAHLNGGVAMKWLQQNVFQRESFEEMSSQAGEIIPGSEGMFFLPYLNGERTPYNNPDAKGIYFGMTMRHNKKHFIRSTMEGIVYSMKESSEIFRNLNLEMRGVIASGGGAKSREFCQIQADMYQCPVYKNMENEQAGLGAAMTAAVGSGFFSSYAEACTSMVHLSPEVIEPVFENTRIYEEGFQKFKELYRANKSIF